MNLDYGMLVSAGVDIWDYITRIHILAGTKGAIDNIYHDEWGDIETVIIHFEGDMMVSLSGWRVEEELVILTASEPISLIPPPDTAPQEYLGYLVSPSQFDEIINIMKRGQL